eukprot:1941800-Amphidinium_carterae.1
MEASEGVNCMDIHSEEIQIGLYCFCPTEPVLCHACPSIRALWRTGGSTNEDCVACVNWKGLAKETVTTSAKLNPKESKL